MRWPLLFPSPEQVAMMRLVKWLNARNAPDTPSTREISQALRLTPVQVTVMLSKLAERGLLEQA